MSDTPNVHGEAQCAWGAPCDCEARAASQERPRADLRAVMERLLHYVDAAATCVEYPECDHRPYLREEYDLARGALRASQERPSIDVERPDWLEEAENGPWKKEGRIEGDDADGVWLTNEDGDSLWLASDDVAWLLNRVLSEPVGESQP